MLAFSENKKKRVEKSDDKDLLKEHKRQPAWHDKHVEKL